MGYWKQRLIEESQRDWTSSDKAVCGDCVNDESLKAILQMNEDACLRCDFCPKIPAAPMDVLLEALVKGLKNEYENAVDGVFWDGREGGFQWEPIWTTWDLLVEFEWVFRSESLFLAVNDAVHDISWVEYDFITRRRDIELSEAWRCFCEAVKYDTRYVLWLLPRDEDIGPGDILPADILENIGPLVDRLGLINELPPGYRLWRAHAHSEPEIEHSASRLGTVPVELALHSNRMSPAGIPMFYGSTDIDTAIRESIWRPDSLYVTYAQFELTAALPVVDFRLLSKEPSIFDPELGSLRRQIRFLNIFAKQLSDRTIPEHEQIDYVPTQVVTEYLLHIHGVRSRIGGLIFQSSLTNEFCAVLNIRNDHCVDPFAIPPNDSVALRLVSDSVQCRPITDADRTS